MPSASLYYSDLQIPSVGDDASTYGNIINTYLDELLTKLLELEQRVAAASAQLGLVNNAVNDVNRMDNSLATAVSGQPILSGTTLSLLTDPLPNYTLASTWPAYSDLLIAIPLPTTPQQVAEFRYQAFMTRMLNLMSLLSQRLEVAENDILEARKNTCRAAAYIDAYDPNPVLTTYEVLPPVQSAFIANTVTPTTMVLSPHPIVATTGDIVGGNRLLVGSNTNVYEGAGGEQKFSVNQEVLLVELQAWPRSFVQGTLGPPIPMIRLDSVTVGGDGGLTLSGSFNLSQVVPILQANDSTQTSGLDILVYVSRRVVREAPKYVDLSPCDQITKSTPFTRYFP